MVLSFEPHNPLLRPYNAQLLQLRHTVEHGRGSQTDSTLGMLAALVAIGAANGDGLDQIAETVAGLLDGLLTISPLLTRDTYGLPP